MKVLIRSLSVLIFSVFLNNNVTAEDTSSKQIVPCFVMTNFIVHDNSYFSSQEATKITYLLQVILTEKTPYNWVSRDKVEETLKELKIGTIDLLKSSSSLKIGNWVRADILLKGDIYRQKDNNWLLLIDVIDLAHADIICQIGLRFTGRPNSAFSFDPEDPSVACETIIPVLRQAIEVLQKQKNKLRVAPLFFQNKEPGGRLDFYEKDIRDAFAKSENSNVKFIQFPRATESIQEAELTVAGLVDSDPDSWRKLSDYYVWGTYEEVEASGVPFDKVTVKAVITTWDGINSPKEFSETATVSELALLSNKITTRVAHLCQGKSNGQPQTNIRSQIARDLTERARDMQELVLQIEHENYPNISDTWWKRRNYAIQLLSVASFFDPANEDIRTRLLVETYRDDIDNLLKVKSGLFWRKWARSDAWKEHCEKFGFKYELEHMPKLKWRKGLADNRLFYPSSAQQYLSTVLELIEECDDHKRRFRDKTSIPKSIPGPIVQIWKQNFCTDFSERLLNATTLCSEKFKEQSGTYLLAVLRNSDDVEMQHKTIEALWENAKRCPDIWYAKEEVEGKVLKIYSAKGNIERGKSLLAMLPQEDPRQITKMPNGVTYITTKKHILEQYGWSATEKNRPQPPIKSDEVRNTSSDTAPITKSHPLVPTVKIPDVISPQKALLNPVSLEEVFGVQETTAMIYARDRLWVAVQGQKKNPQMDQGSTILLYDFRSNKILDLSRRLGNLSEITSMLLDGETLWVTFSANGVWAINTHSLKVNKYAERDGLTSNEMHCSSAFQNKLFFGGGRAQSASLCAFDKDSLQWLKYDLPRISENKNGSTYYHITEMTSDGNFLALYSHYGGSGTHVLLFDVANNKWLEIGKKLLSEEPDFCNFGKGKHLFVLGLDMDSHGLWITTSKGIALFNLQTMKYDYKCISMKKLTSSFSDRQYVWVAQVNTPFDQNSTEGKQDCHVLCFDKETKKWVCNIPVPYEGKVDKMIKINDVLWLGMNSHKFSLISINLR